MHVYPFCVCWGIIQTQIYNIFLGIELHFKCSSGFIKQSERNAVGCYIYLKIQEQSHLFQRGSCETEMGEIMFVRRKWWDFCSATSQVALCNFIQLFQQQIQFFSDVSIHLWDGASLKSFNLLLFWAQLLQKCICLLSSSTVMKSL